MSSEEEKMKQLQALPIRNYLDQTVVPLLLQAMTEVAKVRLDFFYLLRPQNPIEFIANFLLQNNPEKAQARQQ
ncbi:unnamed protein product (macronuclear) [Paramecium tetraurelia]|uniref:Protein dpy-30 homolog n=1 Tax=Paramecium tetraurelia TaxID=5888 RepID=A0DR20_PARTE|nr:uncharacterized protein GSPATT00002888001 [Paramecium tetraurelia]CAK85487.1 unnamed protein product [Paramecium tetraurelia]|eukprot:XP_001452884.1 hypothetical protein (macronuclear) [Paramecium tetraurelia strain d4-2]